MHSILVKLATITTMLHMALGCAWHHGLAAPHTCMDHGTGSLACDHGGDDACTGHHPDHASHQSGPTVDSGCHPGCQANHQHHHSGCQDDRCSFHPSNKFDPDSIRHLAEYLNGAVANTLLVAVPADYCRIDCSRHPCAPGMRAHLYYCVLVL